MGQSESRSDTLSSIVKNSTNSTALSEKLQLEASLRLQELERRAEENIRLAEAEADLGLMRIEEENRRQVADAKILEELLGFVETDSKKKSSSTSYKSSTQRTENWVTEVAEACSQQSRVDTEINPIITAAVHVNANSVPEDVHRVRSLPVSQPVSASTQSACTLPDLERIQLHKDAHFDSREKSFIVQQKHVSLCEEALPSKDLLKNINVYTCPCYSKFQPVYQHNLDQSLGLSKSTCYSNLFLTKQPFLYNTSQHQSAAYHPSVSYRQESDLVIAISYQLFGSHRQAVGKPTFDSEHSVPYRLGTDYLYRNAHQTPVSNRQVIEEHHPNTHADSHNSCGHPTTIY